MKYIIDVFLTQTKVNNNSEGQKIGREGGNEQVLATTRKQEKRTSSRATAKNKRKSFRQRYEVMKFCVFLGGCASQWSLWALARAQLQGKKPDLRGKKASLVAGRRLGKQNPNQELDVLLNLRFPIPLYGLKVGPDKIKVLSETFSSTFPAAKNEGVCETWMILISGISLFTRLNLKDCLEFDVKATEREDPEEEQSGAGGPRGR
ncbi:hypothetical protein EK904_011223 [Melospiza melodia maxima]|nr:hypothetical protein EK904_011223 [Melospiza melodia maxima]